MKTLLDLFKSSSKKYAKNEAYVMKVGFRYRSFTYFEMASLARKIASYLMNKGLKKGDKVILLGANSPFWIATFWACAISGIIVIPLNIQSRKDFVAKVYQFTKAKLIFFDPFLKHLLNEKMEGVNFYSLEDEVIDKTLFSYRNSKIEETDILQIMFTSGTTGDPKGVILNHQNIISNLKVLSEKIEINEHDTLLSILPLSHIFEQTGSLLCTFKAGGRLIIAEKPTSISLLMKKFKVNKMAAVPEFLNIMMNKIESNSPGWYLKLGRLPGLQLFSRILYRPILSKLGGKLKQIVSGGAPLSRALEEKWNRLGIKVMQGYGLTETSPVIATNTLKNHKKGSVGKILPNLKYKFSKEGELLVKGKSIFSEYYKNKKATDAAFDKDGYFKTGDIGKVDEDGYLFLSGRSKYMILSEGGQNVFPEDIENVLNKISEVKDATVLGIENEAGITQIVAIILSEKKNVKSEKIRLEANKMLASYQQISKCFIWPEDDFPRSATRKVQKEKVREKILSNDNKKENNKSSASLKVLNLISLISGVSAEKIKDSDKLIGDLGFDSLRRIELLARIEEKFMRVIPEEKIDHKITVKDLDKLVRKNNLKNKRNKQNKFQFLKRLAGRIVWPFLVLYIRFFVKLEVVNKEILDDISEPVIFMPNHQSYIDAPILAMALPRRLRKKISFAAAEDVLYEEYKNWSWLVEGMLNSFVLPRKVGSNIREGLENFGKKLDKGYSVVVFPEGKMSTSGKQNKLKDGTGFLATEMNTSVITVRLTGCDYVLPPGKIRIRKRGKVKVIFGEKLNFKFSDSNEYAKDLIEKKMMNLEKKYPNP